MNKNQHKHFVRNNGLSIVFIILFLLSMYGQFITGYHLHNQELNEDGQAALTIKQYVHSGHFLQATFENWESEFLQMGLFVLLTISLRQKGSSESKALTGKEEVDREPSASRKDAPWPVRSGGFILKVYQNSLSIAFFILFAVSFALHFYGSLKNENEELVMKGEAVMSASEYFTNSRLWFESFQNWQSEFLSVFCIIVFSISLRQKGSPQSKPVDASNDETGE